MLFAAKTGRGLQLTNDDVGLFLREAHYRDADLTTKLVEEIAADPLDKRDFLFSACADTKADFSSTVKVRKLTQRMWWQVIKLGRSLVSEITGTSAAKTPLKTQALFPYWSSYDALWAWMEHAKWLLAHETPAGVRLFIQVCCMDLILA